MATKKKVEEAVEEVIKEATEAVEKAVKQVEQEDPTGLIAQSLAVAGLKKE